MWLFFFFAGCGSAPAAQLPEDSLVVDRTGHSRFFVPEVDTRDCAWPTCGGWFLDPVNRVTIPCPDELVANQCYIADMDTSDLRLDEPDPDGINRRARFELAMAEGRLIIEGRLSLGVYSGHQMGRFKVERAWEGQTNSYPSGNWALLQDTGRLCLVAPCAHIDERLLNRRVVTLISDLDFQPSGANEAEVAGALRALETGELIVAGQRYWESGVGGTAPARTVTEFYTVLAP